MQSQFPDRRYRAADKYGMNKSEAAVTIAHSNTRKNFSLKPRRYCRINFNI